MIVDNNPKVKQVGAAAPGDIVRLLVGDEPTFAIVLINEDSPSVVVGTLQPVKAANYSFHMRIRRGTHCVWYGPDWFMKADLGPESWANNRNCMYWPGSLHLDETGWIATFRQAPDDHQNTELSFNLNTNEVVDLTSPSAPFKRWNIWESRDLFVAGEPPLISVEATPLDAIPSG
jgi:hypothetical protein